MKIDDKLKEILSSSVGRFVNRAPDKIIADIKQAFADEGYEKPIFPNKLVKEVFEEHKVGLMSGQTWYERWLKQLNSNPGFLISTDYFEAARRASGLNEEES